MFIMTFTTKIFCNFSYRSVKDNVNVREVAEYFGGKGHNKAATNPITDDMQKQLVKILTKSN